MTMDNNIITFPEPAGLFPKRRTLAIASKADEEVPKNMRTFLFRSLHLILKSDEADLVREVCLDLDKAETKLKAIRRRLKGVQEQAALQVQQLTAADTKLTAAIVAARLSTRPRQEAATAVPFAYTSEEFVEAINQLDPKDREFITGYMRLLLDGGGAA
jgi:hypothetical protein